MSVLAIALNPTVDISSVAKHVEATHKVRTRESRWHAGGGGVNVARVIKRLGGEPKLLISSGGAAGALVEDSLKRKGISLDILEISGETRIAYTVYEEETGDEFRFVPEGPELATVNLLQAMETVEHFSGDFIVASGSLPRSVPDEAYARMAAIARKNGVRFILDTSGTPLQVALNACNNMFLVKPSLREMETYVGHALDRATSEEVAREILAKGAAQYVALTFGGDGASLVGPEGTERLPAVDVKVRSAVGAGDSFVGAMVWKLEQGAWIHDAFRFGLAAGAAAVLTPGTELCHVDDVHRLYETVLADGV
jgi:6-phosphofructokinase 2